MLISIINTRDISGGAGRAAYRLHKGLRHLNQKSIMIVKEKQSTDKDVLQVIPNSILYQYDTTIFNAIQHELIYQNRTPISNTIFSIPYPGYNISNTSVIKNSDIINLHWINNFQSIETISGILKKNIPVVWTLHDQNPFTGGCHYSADCNQYSKDCKDCPQLKVNINDLPFMVLKHRKERLNRKNLTIVTPSKWLANCAKKSKAFADLRIEVIPNSLEIDTFKPISKKKAKRSLGIDPENIILLFGVQSLKEKRKGFEEIKKTISFCQQDYRFKNLLEVGKINLLTFGLTNKSELDLAIPLTNLDFVKSDLELANIYSASDIFILPSLEDNLPNTLLESMACGTPVLGFEVGGIPDVIKNGITGYTVPVHNCESLGKSLMDLIFKEKIRNEMCQNCRKLMVNKFQLKHQAQNYLDLFKDLIKKPKGKNSIKPDNRIEKLQIRLENWESDIQGEFNTIYRKFALKFLKIKEEKIAQKILELAYKDHQLVQKEQQLVQKDHQLVQKEQQLVQKEQQLGIKNQKMNRLEKDITNIYNSYSYIIGRIIICPFSILKKILKNAKNYITKE